MKKMLCLVLLIGGYSLIPVFAQNKKIPSDVISSFQAAYPKAENVEWRNKITGYEADFEMNGLAWEARFTRKGEWKSTEVNLPEQNLPSIVKDGIRKSKFRDWDVKSSYVIYKPGEKAKYHVRVAKSDLQKMALVFTTQGQLVGDHVAI